MTTIVVVALMVDPSHSVAEKTYTPELVREETGRQAQQSCIQYAVAPTANGDHAVVALHELCSSIVVLFCFSLVINIFCIKLFLRLYGLALSSLGVMICTNSCYTTL